MVISASTVLTFDDRVTLPEMVRPPPENRSSLLMVNSPLLMIATAPLTFRPCCASIVLPSMTSARMVAEIVSARISEIVSLCGRRPYWQLP